MRDHVQALTEREKETLRLLLGGHDAKSIARLQGLSVHTINERLRDARRKLQTSSSREAARMLADSERSDPNSLGDKRLGVAEPGSDMRSDEQPVRRQSAGHRLAWLGGGMLIMSLIIAAIVLSPMIEGGNAAAGQGAQTVTVAATVDNAGTNAAQQWVALVDRERWGESWQTAGSLFNTQMSAEKWASTAVEVRRPLGPVVSRTLQTATKTSSLPGAPAGEYEVLEFATNFTNKPAAIETVIVVREVTGWKVAGYFVR